MTDEATWIIAAATVVTSVVVVLGYRRSIKPSKPIIEPKFYPEEDGLCVVDLNLRNNGVHTFIIDNIEIQTRGDIWIGGRGDDRSTWAETLNRQKRSAKIGMEIGPEKNVVWRGLLKDPYLSSTIKAVVRYRFLSEIKKVRQHWGTLRSPFGNLYD